MKNRWNNCTDHSLGLQHWPSAVVSKLLGGHEEPKEVRGLANRLACLWLAYIWLSFTQYDIQGGYSKEKIYQLHKLQAKDKIHSTVNLLEKPKLIQTVTSTQNDLSLNKQNFSRVKHNIKIKKNEQNTEKIMQMWQLLIVLELIQNYQENQLSRVIQIYNWNMMQTTWEQFLPSALYRITVKPSQQDLFMCVTLYINASGS
jgi:hypothetical protein